MPILNLGNDSNASAHTNRAHLNDAGLDGGNINASLLGGDLYTPQSRSRSSAGLEENARRSCANPHCAGGWIKPWRNRKRPVFEGQWGCSTRCVQALLRAALRRENSDGFTPASNAAHRHRVPLGLVMLAQGWITHPQLQAALQSQRASGSGRIGDWLMTECGLEPEQVTRGLSVQWSCPVLTTDGFSARDMALVMPAQFVAEFGLVPLRVAGQRMLYLGCEDRLNASVAYAVEQMSELKVESGLVDSVAICAARNRLLAEYSVPVTVETLTDEDVLVQTLAEVLEEKQPIAARLVRVHQYLWLRLWLESGTRGLAGTLPRSAEDMADYIFAPRRRG